MEHLDKNKVEQFFQECKEIALFGKWITYNDIKPLFNKYKNGFTFQQLGYSEEGVPIRSLQIGSGSKKILFWSQMHGNESTGTKALFDLFNFLQDSNNQFVKTILSNCTLLFLPMLNPDGAKAYTRVNANGIDLNRDAVERVAKESKILRKVLEDFSPHFCFNLHDQRTIFGVEKTENPATLSFLAPSVEETRKITDGRKETMNVIVAMNNLLQKIIPNHIGRYTDEFYPSATGDNFQKLGYNTILVESGHYKEDYVREKSREFTFYAILQGLYHIATSSNFNSYKDYFKIPNNVKIFYDVIHRYPSEKRVEAFQFTETILDNKLVSKLVKLNDNSIVDKIGHTEIVFETHKS